MVYVIDTHALVWFLLKDARLGKAAQSAMQNPAAEIVIPTIVLAEIAFLNRRGRITLDLAVTLGYLAAASNCRAYPLDEGTVQQLPAALNIHDGIIVATALLLQNVLGKPTAVVTKDAMITASGLIPVVW